MLRSTANLPGLTADPETWKVRNGSREVARETAAAYAVHVVNDEAGLHRLRAEWDALVDRSDLRHPFLRHEWVSAWWSCFGAPRTLHVLVARDGSGRAVAIAPLMWSQVRMLGTSLRTLELLLNDHTPRCGFVCSPDAAGACRAIWNHLESESGHWDLILLQQLPDGSAALEHIDRLARAAGCYTGRRHLEDSPYVRFSGTWPAFRATLSRNHRTKINKGLNRLGRIAPVRLEVVAGGADLARALEDGLRIEAAAWKERCGTAMRSQPAVERFYREYAAQAAASGRLRLIFLTCGGARIAFAFAVEDGRKLFVLKAGYDPAYARYSPYNLLCHLVFEDAFARGLDEYEFLGRSESWKLDWTRRTRAHHALFVFNRGPHLRLLHLAKCRVIPFLQRQPLYLGVRDAIAARRLRPRPARGGGGAEQRTETDA